MFIQVPLEGFRALQGISGPQRFQIHKAYGAPKRLPSAHTWSVVGILSSICIAFYSRDLWSLVLILVIRLAFRITIFAPNLCAMYLQFQSARPSWVFLQGTTSRALAACYPWSQWRVWFWLTKLLLCSHLCNSNATCGSPNFNVHVSSTPFLATQIHSSL